MKKLILSFMSLAVLAGCRETGEENETVQQEEVEDESTDEEAESVVEEEEEDEQMPDPVQYEVTTYTDEEITLTVDVGPILIEDGYATLPIVFDSEGEVEASMRDFLANGNVFYDHTNEQYDVRLIDSNERTVSHLGIFSWEHGYYEEMYTPLSTFRSEGENARERYQVGGEFSETHFFSVFEAPQSDEVHVFLGDLGVVSDVPVVNREETTIPTLSEVTEEVQEYEEDEFDIEERKEEFHFIYGVPDVLEVIQMEESSGATAEDPSEHLDNLYFRTMNLESYSQSLDSEVNRIDEIDHSTLILSSDVLFEFDESSLTDEADAELESAIAELEGVEGGELEIVGHTDNEHTEEYNQELSENRADSVHERLGELMELEVFDDVSTRGGSFREPIADNGTDEGRALNRRVELHFTPPTEEIVIESDSELPEAYGLEVDYPEQADTPYGSVEVESVEQVDDFFVGRLKIHSHDGVLEREAVQQRRQYEQYGARAMTQGTHGYELGGIDGVTLLHNGRRYFPIDYYVDTIEGTRGESFEERQEERGDDGLDYMLTLGDRFLGRIQDPNDDAYLYATVVWPALDTDTLIIDLDFPSVDEVGENLLESEIERLAPWRMYDVPVEGFTGETTLEEEEDSEEADEAETEDEEADEENDEDE